MYVVIGETTGKTHIGSTDNSTSGLIKVVVHTSNTAPHSYANILPARHANMQEQVMIHTLYARTLMGKMSIPQHENNSLVWPDPTQLGGRSDGRLRHTLTSHL